MAVRRNVRPPGVLQRSEPAPTRAEALAELHQDICQQVAAGRSIPCVQEEGGWTADDSQSRARAAWRCLDCAAFLACERYVTEYPEQSGVWAGRGYSVYNPPTNYLDRPEPPATRPDCKTPYVRPKRRAGIVPQAIPSKPRLIEHKEIAMAKNSNPASDTCKCGCGETAPRNYRPGHDARHVSQLARAVRDGSLDKRAALRAVAASEKLQAKLTRALAKKAAQPAEVTE